MMTQQDATIFMLVQGIANLGNADKNKFKSHTSSPNFN
jgi:hypothetical protein